jgi:hypothetical protein
MQEFKGQRFTRDQLVFVAEAALVSVIDRIESNMPTSGMTWEDRISYVNADINPGRLSSYERGALECAGMALAVLFAQLTDDGISIYDALRCAGKFDEAVDAWVTTTWQDQGKAVIARMKQLGQGGWTIPQAYENYPDCHKHAEAFVDDLFKEYLYVPQARLWDAHDGK